MWLDSLTPLTNVTYPINIFISHFCNLHRSPDSQSLNSSFFYWLVFSLQSCLDKYEGELTWDGRPCESGAHTFFSTKTQWTSWNFWPNIVLKYESDASGFAYLYLIDWLEIELIKKCRINTIDTVQLDITGTVYLCWLSHLKTCHTKDSV